jgi:hypothetical protein
MYKKFISIFFIFTFLILFTQLIVNYYFDPYGFNGKLKFVDGKSARIFKPYDVIEKDPSVVIIGNSRNYYSFSPSDNGHDNTYNLSLPGVGIIQIRSLYEHVINSKLDIDELIITLDLFCDPLSIDPINNSLDDRVLIANNNSLIRTKINKILLYLSLDASYASYKYNGQPKNNYLANDGRAVSFDEFSYLEKGPGNALAARESRNISRRINKSDNLNVKNYTDYKKQCQTDNLNYIIDSAIKNNIKISFFLNPVNVRYWEIYSYFDQLPSYVYYPKKLIQEKLNNVPEAHQHLFEGFDFLRLNRFTLEPISYSDLEEYSYWYESSHYNLTFGNILLSNIFNKDFKKIHLVANLKHADLDADYLQQKTLLHEWRVQNPELKKEVLGTIENILN